MSNVSASGWRQARSRFKTSPPPAPAPVPPYSPIRAFDSSSLCAASSATLAELVAAAPTSASPRTKHAFLFGIVETSYPIVLPDTVLSYPPACSARRSAILMTRAAAPDLFTSPAERAPALSPDADRDTTASDACPARRELAGREQRPAGNIGRLNWTRRTTCPAVRPIRRFSKLPGQWRSELVERPGYLVEAKVASEDVTSPTLTRWHWPHNPES